MGNNGKAEGIAEIARSERAAMCAASAPVVRVSSISASACPRVPSCCCGQLLGERWEKRNKGRLSVPSGSFIRALPSFALRVNVVSFVNLWLFLKFFWWRDWGYECVPVRVSSIFGPRSSQLIRLACYEQPGIPCLYSPQGCCVFVN
jgi:hypothetical protein